MNSIPTQGFPPVILLFFTILIWILFLSIFLSNYRNQQNRWCFFAGMLFSLGAFKEYLYFGLTPILLAHFPQIPESVYLHIYSIMTAVLYYFAMPAVTMLSLYFNGFDKRNPKIFHFLKYLLFIPGILTCFFIPYWNTRYYQLNVPGYFIYVGIYNWLFGIFVTWLLLSGLYHSRQSFSYQQKKMVAVNVLLPMWYWLVTVFVFHIFRLRPLFKAWQGNLFVVLFLLGYFVLHVFQDGIWGTRLNLEHYDWTKNTQAIQRNTDYVSHALKNELAKIKWCAQILAEQSQLADSQELQIICRSTEHLEDFIQRTRLLSKDITLQPVRVEMGPFLRDCIVRYIPDSPKLCVETNCEDGLFLLCDPVHLCEALHNLLQNAIEAIKGSGTIRISFQKNPRRRYAVLTIQDNGCGMTKENSRKIFQPYYTTKPAAAHLGLGLYYCYHVMDKHHGRIQVKSEVGKGTAISLYFPLEKNKTNAFPIS